MFDAKVFCKNRAVHFKKHTPQKMLSSFYTILQFFISTIIHEFSTKRSFLKQEIYIQADCTNLHVFHCVLLGIYEFPAHKSIPPRQGPWVYFLLQSKKNSYSQKNSQLPEVFPQKLEVFGYAIIFPPAIRMLLPLI